MRRRVAGCVITLLVAFGISIQSANAAIIDTTDIIAIPAHVDGSGNGTLDMRLFTFSGSEIQNSSGAFNGDNGNNTLPQGGGTDTQSFVESYVTTAGELKAFYTLNFPSMSVSEIMILLDLNETGTAQLINTLDKLDIVLNPTTIQGNPNPSGDVLGAGQAAINQVYTSGTKIAYLSPEPANNLPINSQGAGFADYAIFTGVNPFALNDSDVILFNISMSTLNDGAEELYLSGKYAPTDIPEPSMICLLGLGGLALLRKRR